MLSIKDRILLGMAALEDFVTEIHRVGGLAEIVMQNTYGWVPPQYRKGSSRRAVWRMLKTGYIEKVIKNGEAHFRLTGRGVKKVVRDFPLIRLQRKKWDRLWRIVIFDIPVAHNYLRDRLRAKLEELGFGMFQESVWMTPYDLAREISDFIQSQGLEEFVYVFVSPLGFVKDKKALVEKIWKVEKIDGFYQDWVEDWEEKSHGISEKKLRGLAQKFCSSYLEIVAIDPFLPKELLPDSWMGDRARSLFKKLTKVVAARK